MIIERRFNGPPDSGNGGIACGLLASTVDFPVPEVTLRLPPPLGVDGRHYRSKRSVELVENYLRLALKRQELVLLCRILSGL